MLHIAKDITINRYVKGYKILPLCGMYFLLTALYIASLLAKTRGADYIEHKSKQPLNENNSRRKKNIQLCPKLTTGH